MAADTLYDAATGQHSREQEVPAVHDHPVFTQVYRVLAAAGERTGLGDVRARVLSAAHGRLLIVGLGPGHDLDHLPAAVTEVIAIEPSASMRAAAGPRVQAARARGVAVEVVDAVAEDLPLADASVDSALVAYVLCTVVDPGAAAAEVHRVVRPGGVVGVLEHVRGSRGSNTARLQALVKPLWPHVAGGCRVDRDTGAVLRAAGFDLTEVREVSLATLPPVAPTLVGVARRAPATD